MKKKRRSILVGTAVVLFLVAGFILTIVLCRDKREQNRVSAKREINAIRQVLHENAMAASYDTPDNTLTGIMTIVGRRRSIDTSKCPDDFRSAYERYVNAWENMLDQLLSNPEFFEDEFFHKPLSEHDIDYYYILSKNSGDDSGFQARIQAMLQRQNNRADLSLRMLVTASRSEWIAISWIRLRVVASQYGIDAY